MFVKIICKNCSVQYDTVEGMYCPNCGTLNNNIQAPSNQTNGFCIAGLILSFFSSILGLIFSLIGLNKIKKTQEQGKGIAIAGIIISVIKLVAIVGMIFFFLIFAVALSTELENETTFNSLCQKATYCEYDYSTDSYDCLYEDAYGDYQYISCDEVEEEVISDSDYTYYDDYYYDY